jgi:hypothetical protein
MRAAGPCDPLPWGVLCAMLRSSSCPSSGRPLPDRISPGPDGQVLLDLEVRNPLNHKLRLAVEVNGAEFMLLDQPAPRTIASGDTARLPIRLGVGQGRLGEVKAFGIQFRFEDLPWSPTMCVPVSFNTIHAGQGHRLGLPDLGQRSFTKRRARFELTSVIRWFPIGRKPARSLA